MMKTWPIILFLLFKLSFASAQTLLQSSTVLKGVANDPSLQLSQQQSTFANAHMAQLPLLDKVALRTETDRFELRRQEYLSRFSVNGLAEIKGQKKLNESNLALIRTDERMALHKALNERYQLLVEAMQLDKEIRLQTALQQIYRDKLLVLHKMADLNSDADIEETIRTEYDADLTESRLLDLRQKNTGVRLALMRMAGTSDANWLLDKQFLIPPNRLNPDLMALDMRMLEYPAIAQKTAKADMAAAEYRLEKAQGQQMLDYFQLRYANKPSEPWRSDLSLSLGFTLPYNGSAKVKTADKLIAENDALLELQLLQTDLGERLDEAQARLAALEMQWAQTQDRIVSSNAWLTPEKTALLSEEGPLPLLRYQELLLKRELLLLNTESEMYEQYLNILDWSGQISAQPLRNYLEEGWPLLSE